VNGKTRFNDQEEDDNPLAKGKDKTSGVMSIPGTRTRNVEKGCGSGQGTVPGGRPRFSNGRKPDGVSRSQDL